MIHYMTVPAPPDADDLRKHKYPYMSCEVLCCDVASMVNTLVDERDGALLHDLFAVVRVAPCMHDWIWGCAFPSPLPLPPPPGRPPLLPCPSSLPPSQIRSETPVSHRLAGYFEKVLNIVFRRKSMSVVSYINGCGLPLLQSFARQLHNHSAMQSLRVLLLPGIGMAREDSSMVGYGFDDIHEPEQPEPETSLDCSWHSDEKVRRGEGGGGDGGCGVRPAGSARLGWA